jgi:single-stranded-DNA-specific exonuclease
MITKQWDVYPRISPLAEEELSIFSPILRQILFNRGISTKRSAIDFLSARTPKGTEPHQLQNMAEAVDRISFAIRKGEKIAVYGDYDADGVTATALMVETLKALGANAHAYIPNRFEEGYGLNINALDELHKDQFNLVVTVDCGIRAIDQIDHANNLGIDIIVTDHHHPGGELPEAYAVINPKIPGDSYPDKDLAGVGVAYKLASALVKKIAISGFYTESLLDLVALGTVADLVPLVGENRSLVRSGLKHIRRPHRQGLLSLTAAAGIHPMKVNSTQIGFILGPRLNAAGRLDSAILAYELLTTRDISRAGQLAQQLDNQNRERQKITREMQILAEEIALKERDQPFLIFASDPSFNPGVVGLTAARMVDKFYRPAIVAHQGDELTRGSCRSVPEFHITDALDKCADLLTHHGGHAAAAGFTVENSRVPDLVERLQVIARDCLAEKDLRPVVNADMEVPLSSLNFELLQELDQLQPTGYGNPDPIFITRNLRVANSKQVGRDRSHLRLSLDDGSKTLNAIAFRQGYWQETIPPRIDVAYQFEANEYNGMISLQLNVRDIKPSKSTH